MTSNLGATRSRSGRSASAPRARTTRRRHTSRRPSASSGPEFVNRIDRIVAFRPLGEETIRQIARRELGRLLLLEGITRRQLLVEVDDPVIEVLGREGFHPRYGARPLQREIERAVISPLARLVVDRSPGPGDLARVLLRDGEIAVELTRVEEPTTTAAKPRPRARSGSGTFARAVRACEEFAALLESENAAPAVEELRAEHSRLVETTHDPAFWDESDEARRTLSRLYRTELVLDRFDNLRRRAEGLAGFARDAAALRSRPRLREVWEALDEMDDGLAATRLELAGAVLDASHGLASVRVVPIGEESGEWADELVAMYAAWAGRTGRELERGAERTIRIEGLSTFDLLRAEAGIHRRTRAGREPELARVIVLDGDTDDDGGEAGFVVRVYEDGKRRGVRDPRTGVRRSHLIAVLAEGRIDEFLLAGLRVTGPDRPVSS